MIGFPTQTDARGRRSSPALLVAAGVLACATSSASALNDPNQFCSGDPCVIYGTKPIDPGITLDFGTRAVVLQGTLALAPLPTGDIGSATITAGSFSITGDGQIEGFSSSHAAGTLTIEVGGDIRIDSGATSGAVRLYGEPAGTLTLRAPHGLVHSSSRINLAASGASVSGGTLTVKAEGAIELTNRIDADGGVHASGGTIDLTGGGNVSMTGNVDLTGGEDGGGSLYIDAGGSLMLGHIDISGSGDGGDGGQALISAGGDVQFLDLFEGRGSDSSLDCGDGADVDVTAGGAITIADVMSIQGRGLDCTGGSLSLDGASVFMQQHVDMSGTGTQGDGGDLDVSADSLIRVDGQIAIDGGEGGGGDFSLDSRGDLVITDDIDASGRTGASSGGLLASLHAATITVSGTATIDGSGGGSTVSGVDLVIEGCTVVVQSGANIRSTGSTGSITVKAHQAMTVAGHLSASTAGGIALRYGPTAGMPNTSGAVFAPAAQRILDATLTPCICRLDSDCVDGNQCTFDLCDNFTACHNPAHTGSCDDGDPCTTSDTCAAGVCTGGPHLTCNDLNPCTADSCLTGMGCQHAPVPGSCNDGDACTTGDACVAGTCVGTPMDCNDGNACTDGDACSNGVCTPGGPADCDDHDVCTSDSCDTVQGCLHTPIFGCTDGDHDGVSDDIDDCTTLVWTSPPTSPPDQNPLRLALTLGNLTEPDGNQRVFLTGLFNPAPSALPIDPSTDGLHIHIADATGPLSDVSLPGGSGGCDPSDGWKTHSAGFYTTWHYRNRSGALPPACLPGSARGIVSAMVKDRRASARHALQFKIKAKDATLLRDPDPPLTRLALSVTLGAEPTPGIASQQAIAGQCAEAVFTGNPIAGGPSKPYCRTRLFNAAIDSVSCKGE